MTVVVGYQHRIIKVCNSDTLQDPTEEEMEEGWGGVGPSGQEWGQGRVLPPV